MSFKGLVAASIAALLVANPVLAADTSSGRQAQAKGQAEIPICTKRLGTIAIVEPENQWWRELSLGSPEAIIKVFVMKSGCFGLVDRGRGLQNRNLERALADSGELQQGSNIGRAQVKAADYFIVPDIVSSNSNSGGGGIGGLVGGFLGGSAGALLGGAVSMKKKEANVTLTLTNARTTEQERLTEGYYRKRDVSFGGGGGAGWWGGLAGAAGGGYANTDIGQVIVLAYLDAYKKLVTELGGLPLNPSAAAPVAQ